MRLLFKTSSVTPDFFYVFNIILSISTCSQSFKKKCTWEILGANVRKLSSIFQGALEEVTSAKIISVVKALASENTLLRTHCCRHKCFSVCPRAQHLLQTHTKKGFAGILFSNILCPQLMFPSLRSPRNIMGNNVSATMCPRMPGPIGSIFAGLSSPVWLLWLKSPGSILSRTAVGN